MKNDVTVGVQKWAGDQRADAEHPANAELRQEWVRVGDALITAEDHGLIEVSYGVSEPAGFGEVVIRLFTSSFKTADVDEAEH